MMCISMDHFVLILKICNIVFLCYNKQHPFKKTDNMINEEVNQQMNCLLSMFQKHLIFTQTGKEHMQIYHIPGVCRPASLPESFSSRFSERLQKRTQVESNRERVSLLTSGVHTNIHGHMNPYTYVDKHTQTTHMWKLPFCLTFKKSRKSQNE